MTQECKSNVKRIQRFDGHCYNCNKYVHRAFECRSKPMWTPNQHVRRDINAHHYNWDYNTRQSCHYCQEYGHIPYNFIRTHFKGNYKRCLSQTTCFSFLETRHVSRNCPTKAKTPKVEVNKGKGKVDEEYIRVDMKKTWKKRDVPSTSNRRVTSLKRSSDHTSSN